MHRVLPVLILMLSVAVVSSCSDSDDKVIGVDPSPSKYENLSERDHVLANLELSYNDRNLERLVELLDEDFVFHFSPSDIREGYVAVEQWNRAAEVSATTNLFDTIYDGPWPPASAIELSLVYSDSDTSWKALTPEDQEKYPGETWYVKPVLYSMIVTAGDFSIGGVRIPACFVVRSVDVDGRTIWRIVEWYDEVDELPSRPLAKTTNRDAAVEETTWGRMKALYAP